MSKLKTLYQNEGIELEYIARGSPKQNGLVEKKMNLIREKAMKIMVHYNTNKGGKVKLWSEAVYCSVFMEC